MIIFPIVAFHVFMSWLCANNYTRAYRRAGVKTGWAWDMFLLAFCLGWLVVPEMWDNSHFEKYNPPKETER